MPTIFATPLKRHGLDLARDKIYSMIMELAQAWKLSQIMKDELSFAFRLFGLLLLKYASMKFWYQNLKVQLQHILLLEFLYYVLDCQTYRISITSALFHIQIDKLLIKVLPVARISLKKCAIISSCGAILQSRIHFLQNSK